MILNLQGVQNKREPPLGFRMTDLRPRFDQIDWRMRTRMRQVLSIVPAVLFHAGVCYAADRVLGDGMEKGESKRQGK
jgi:hypothetical protein